MTSTEQDLSMFLDVFYNPDHAARYAEGPPQFMPGFADLHRMAAILIRERAPADARILVHGAGGGLELRAFADGNPGWQFLGIDPALPMLEEAEQRLGPHRARAQFHHGTIDTAPEGPFDAATSLLVLHFLKADDRRATVKQIIARLKPGAPLVVAHGSFPQAPDEREVWLKRYAAFGIIRGADPEMAENARKTISSADIMFDPETDEDILRDAGLTNVTPFYAAFTWRGWVGYAP